MWIGAFTFTFAFCIDVHAIDDNAGTKNGAFLRIPTDARGVVLGHSMAALARGTEAMRWNPAALGFLDSKEAAFTHIQYYQDVKIENASFAYPMEESGLAANVFYLNPGTLDGRDTGGNATGDFTFYNLVGAIGYGRKIFTRNEGAEVTVGASVKIVQEKIADSQYQNPALDVGAVVSPWDDTYMGFSLRNFASSKADFPKEVLAGASRVFFRSFTAGAGVRYTNDSPLRYSVSGEYKMPQYPAMIRAGYQTHDSLDSSTDSDISAFRSGSIAGLTMGAGFEYIPPVLQGVKLQLDYAMAPFGSLGISHTVTVKVRW